MTLIRNKIKSLTSLLLLAVSVAAIFVLNSCDCLGTDEKLTMFVFAGERSDCNKLMKDNNASNPGIAYVCPGEKVTVCWTSSALQKLVMDINGSTHSVSTSGSEVVTITANTTITLKPETAKCVSSRTSTVTVVNGPTPSTWQAGWDCSTIRFAISDAFVSSKIIAKDITANWTPYVNYTDASGTRAVVCTTPPFLKAEHQEEAYGFEIKQPDITQSFTRNIKAVGHWNFVLQAVCPQGEYKCERFISFPFNVTLDCL